MKQSRKNKNLAYNWLSRRRIAGNFLSIRHANIVGDDIGKCDGNGSEECRKLHFFYSKRKKWTFKFLVMELLFFYLIDSLMI